MSVLEYTIRDSRFMHIYTHITGNHINDVILSDEIDAIYAEGWFEVHEDEQPVSMNPISGAINYKNFLVAERLLDSAFLAWKVEEGEEYEIGEEFETDVEHDDLGSFTMYPTIVARLSKNLYVLEYDISGLTPEVDTDVH